jgi:hypothetical protein
MCLLTLQRAYKLFDDSGDGLQPQRLAERPFIAYTDPTRLPDALQTECIEIQFARSLLSAIC